jgi:hypothetical protein
VWQGSIPNVTVSAARPEATIPDLMPSFVYTVRIIANNSIGRSPPSDVITATTLEEAPSGPPFDVSVKAVGSQDLQVTWQVCKSVGRAVAPHNVSMCLHCLFFVQVG